MVASRDILFWTPREQLFRDKRINPVKKKKKIYIYIYISKSTATNPWVVPDLPVVDLDQYN